MRKLTLRKGSIPLFIVCFVSLLTSLSPSSARADSYTTYGANDFYFTFEEPQNFTVRTYASQYGIDSMLWLYDSENTVLRANDDYYGLDSYISIDLQPGTYRLRTGVCCGDPNRWYGNSYRVETSTSMLSNQVTPTTTTTLPPTTTTTIPLPDNANWSMVMEGGVFQLDAPDGFVFSDILFASYGTPNGQSGRWSIGECHAQNSMEIISNLAIGFSTFSVDVNNSVFGDPCGGVVKRLAVTALYAPAPTTTTTTTTTTSTTTTLAPTTTTTLPPTTTTVFFQLPIATTTTSTTTTTTSTTTTTTVPPTTTTTIVPTTTTTIPVEITEEITPEQAVNVATSAEVLQEISKDDAVEVFKAIDTSTISEEEKTEIIDAVQNAPDEVKEAFEGEINIYADGFDEYVPVGSEISVKSRRTLLAAMGAVSAITVAGASGSGSTPSGGGSNGNNGNGPNSHFKKDEEESEDEEEAPEIEGPEGGDDGEFTRNSIFKYREDGMRKFSIWNFIKKFSRETAALAFTISSTVIVFATLSGDTRKITLIATSVAFAVHYLSVMIKNDE